MPSSVTLNTGAAGRNGPPSEHPKVEEIMLAEILHRNANDLGVLLSHLHLVRRHVAGEAAERIDTAIAYVGSVSRVQRLMLPPLWHGAVELSAAVEKVCLAFKDAHLADGKVQLDVEMEDWAADARDAWMICAVVIELVTNAAQHAFGGNSGTIKVSGHRKHGAFVIHVTDDGARAGGKVSGFSRPSTGGGRGTAIIDAMVEELGGEIRRSFGPNGTNVEFWLGLAS